MDKTYYWQPRGITPRSVGLQSVTISSALSSVFLWYV